MVERTVDGAIGEFGALIWACGAATGALAAIAAFGFWRWKQRFLPYSEITAQHKGT